MLYRLYNAKRGPRKYHIEHGSNPALYLVYGKFFGIGNNLELKDHYGKVYYSIKQIKYFNLYKPQYKILDGDGNEVATILGKYNRKFLTIKSLTTTITSKFGSFTICGEKNNSRGYYILNHNQLPVAYMQSKSLMGLADYSITTYEHGYDDRFILALATIAHFFIFELKYANGRITLNPFAKSS